VAKLVSRLLATSALWLRIQKFLQKYKKGDISKGVTNASLARKKNCLSALFVNSYNGTDVRRLLTACFVRPGFLFGDAKICRSILYYLLI
jgi:hypothetical protein